MCKVELDICIEFRVKKKKLLSIHLHLRNIYHLSILNVEAVCFANFKGDLVYEVKQVVELTKKTALCLCLL